MRATRPVSAMPVQVRVALISEAPANIDEVKMEGRMVV
jgi:hypothetical protein